MQSCMYMGYALDLFVSIWWHPECFNEDLYKHCYSWFFLKKFFWEKEKTAVLDWFHKLCYVTYFWKCTSDYLVGERVVPTHIVGEGTMSKQNKYNSEFMRTRKHD